MARNLRGAYMTFAHDRAEDWQFLRDWQPNVVRLMVQGNHNDPNSVSVPLIERVHQTCPNATILLRCWDVDDRNFEAHAAMAQDPKGEAARQVDWWASLLDRIQGVPRNQLMAGLNNETGPEKDGALYDYTMRALALATTRQVRLGVFVFSVGRPALTGESQYDMAYFARLEPLILANNGAVLLHEYMQPEGMYAVWTDEHGNERKDYTYLIGRHMRWPLNVPIIIGEWSIDGLLYNRHPHPIYGNNGWHNFSEWPPSRYADEYVECIRQASDNVIGICPFLSDNGDSTGKWKSFDVLEAYGELLKRKDLCVKDSPTPPFTTRLPAIEAPPPAPVEPPKEPTPMPSGDNWARSIAFTARWEGGYQNVENDVGNWTGGAVGVGENRGTNFGVSAASYPHLDIKNLTREQAHEIFKRDYWQASGADKLSWPACLIVFDTAILHGVGTAKAWQAEVGTNAFAFAAKRLRVYPKLANWDYWGRGWVNRVADLLVEASK